MFQILKILKQFNITNIVDNSTKVNVETAFFCNEVAQQKHYDEDAIVRGCKFIIYIGKNNIQEGSIYKITIAWNEYIDLLKQFYPNDDVVKIAITGTNGKTSTAHFGASLASYIVGNSATIGTNGLCVYKEGNIVETIEIGLTTPTSTAFYYHLSTLQKQNIKYVFVEASSIGIEQGRIDGIKFDVSCFTNLTQDHLDHHHTMEEYFYQKSRLFTEFTKKEGNVILNINSPYSEKIQTNCQKTYYGMEDFTEENNKFLVTIGNQRATFPLQGRFQVMNLFCAVHSLLALGFVERQIAQYIPNISAPSGRMQFYQMNKINIVIDFAHTPDALDNLLQNIDGEKIVIFGCGGNRDKTKRSKMGEIASQYAKHVIITNDNPRHEDQLVIAEDIAKGCNCNHHITLDRQKAIVQGIEMCLPRGTVVIAGKGNEMYQIIGDTKYEYSDVTVVENIVQNNLS